MSATITTSDTNMREHIGYEVRADEETVLLLQLMDFQDESPTVNGEKGLEKLLEHMGLLHE